jgi:hypothetical protein
MTAPTLLFRDTPRVRNTDPLTSHAAADTNDIAASSRFVLYALKGAGPLADHELVALHDRTQPFVQEYFGTFTPQRLRTARHELTEIGMIEATGYFRLTPSGRKANVWQVTA